LLNNVTVEYPNPKKKDALGVKLIYFKPKKDSGDEEE